jgi:hypothetical protein
MQRVALVTNTPQISNNKITCIVIFNTPPQYIKYSTRFPSFCVVTMIQYPCLVSIQRVEAKFCPLLEQAQN